MLKNNPADGVEAPVARSREIIPIDEIQAAWLLTVAEGTRLYIPIVLAVCAGLRRGEILALRWGDLDPARAALRVATIGGRNDGRRFIQGTKE